MNYREFFDKILVKQHRSPLATTGNNGLTPYRHGVRFQSPGTRQSSGVIELLGTPFNRRGRTWDTPEGRVISSLSAGQVAGFFDPVERQGSVERGGIPVGPELDRARDGCADPDPPQMHEIESRAFNPNAMAFTYILSE